MIFIILEILNNKDNGVPEWNVMERRGIGTQIAEEGEILRLYSAIKK